MKKTTLKKIAEKLGCTHSTVSRALNNRSGVSAELRLKILKIADRERYMPRQGSRSVAIIQTLVPDVPDFYSALLTHYLSLELKKNRLRSIIIHQEDMDFLTDHFVCGAISLCIFEQIAKSWPDFHSQTLVCINDYSNIPDNIYSVNSDEQKVIREITAELAAAGHRKVTLFIGWDSTLSHFLRQKLFLETGPTFGVEYNPVTFKTPIRNSAARRLIRAIPAETTALVASSEHLTFPLLSAVIYEKRKFFTVGWVYDIHVDRKLMPDMVIQQNLPEIAQKAASILKSSLSGNNLNSRDLLVPYHILESEKNG